MKYYPSDYIRALSKYDARLEVFDGETAGVLLIDEKSMDLFVSETHIPMELIVLVESEESRFYCGKHKIKKRILKFQKVKKLLVEIFDERYEIRLFLEPFCAKNRLEYLLEHNVLDAPFVSCFDEYRYSDSLISESKYLERGRHYFYSSLLDVMDPPITFMVEAVLRQSKIEPVDIVLYSLNGLIAKKLIEISDVVYILLPLEREKEMGILKKRYSNIIFLKWQKENDGVEMTDILSRRGEYEL